MSQRGKGDGGEEKQKRGREGEREEGWQGG